MEYEFRFSKDGILQKLGEDRYFWIWKLNYIEYFGFG